MVFHLQTVELGPGLISQELRHERWYWQFAFLEEICRIFERSALGEALIRDDPLQCIRYLRHLRMKHFCDVIRSSIALAISTSLIHNIAIVGHPELEHFSIGRLRAFEPAPPVQQGCKYSQF